MDQPARLAALRSACALVERALPDRDPHPDLYNLLCQLIDILTTSGMWAEDYVRFELALLADLGFGLDSPPVPFGSDADLVYVSPRTGRAVSTGEGGVYEDRLLPLPGFLISDEHAMPPPSGRSTLDGAFLNAISLPLSIVQSRNQRQALIDRLTARNETSFAEGEKIGYRQIDRSTDPLRRCAVGALSGLCALHHHRALAA